MDVEPAFATAHADLIYELENLGFIEEQADLWSGTLDTTVGARAVRITFAEHYPARPPQVSVPDVPWTWHQERNGNLCLWSQTTPGHFPWLQPGVLASKIREWAVHADNNWVGVEPDLDLERYWEPSQRYDLILLPEVDGLSGWVRLEHEPRQRLLTFESRRTPPNTGRRKGGYKYAIVVDLQEPVRPPRTWQDVAAGVGDSPRLLDEIRTRRADILVLRYTLGGKRGAFGLVYEGGPLDAPLFRSVAIAQGGSGYQELRSGHLAQELSNKTVVIVGVGSVGSFVAENLARAGVRRFILVDQSRLRPGHLPRYAFSAPLGWDKVDVVALALRARGAEVGPRKGFLLSLDGARSCIEGADCVIDATANEVVTGLLVTAASESGKKFVSTYLANDGQDLVAEILPTTDGTMFRPPTRERLAADGYESGCGDAVSPTSPYAVQETALMATRAAIIVLCPSLAPPIPTTRDYTW